MGVSLRLVRGPLESDGLRAIASLFTRLLHFRDLRTNPQTNYLRAGEVYPIDYKCSSWRKLKNSTSAQV